MPAGQSNDASPHLQGGGPNRTHYLPRLPREYYQGDAIIHWTLPIAMGRRGWLDDRFHSSFREIMLHAAARESLLCPTYCLMPDHLHLLWTGLRRDSDQINGIKFLREHLGPRLQPHRFQHQAHDHVLPGYPALHPLEEEFWPLFWKLYQVRRALDAGEIKRPPIGS